MTSRFSNNVAGSSGNDGLTILTPKLYPWEHTTANGDVHYVVGTDTAYDRVNADIGLNLSARSDIQVIGIGSTKPVWKHTQAVPSGYGRIITYGTGRNVCKNIIFRDSTEGGIGGSGAASRNLVEDCEFYDIGLTNDQVVLGGAISFGTSAAVAELRVLRTIVRRTGKGSVYGQVTDLQEVAWCDLDEPGLADAGNTGDNIMCIGDCNLYHVHHNRLRQPKNAKQCVQHSGGTSGLAVIEDNEMIGPSGIVTAHNTIYVELPAVVRRNRLRTGGVGILLKAASDVSGNLVIVDGTGYGGGSLGAIFIENVVGGASSICNNTVRLLEGGGADMEVAIAMWHGDSGTIQNNAVIGGWVRGIRRHDSATTESYNAFDGPATAVADQAEDPIDAGEYAVTSALQLASDYRPAATSPLRGAGLHLGYRLDLNGRLRRNPPSIGAVEAA